MAKNREFTGKKDLPDSGDKASPRKSVSYGGFSFVEGYLNDTDKQWLEDNLDGAEEYIYRLVFELPEGYKLSLSFDGKSERYLATLACSLPESADNKKILTSRGATQFDALFGLYYRHFVKFADGWGLASGVPTSRWD